MFDTRTYICEICAHESVCKYAKEMRDLEDMLAVSDLKDLKDMASVKVTCRNRVLRSCNKRKQVMAENYGD